MKEKEFDVIVRKLKVFGFGKVQDLITLFGILEREKISIENVKEFVQITLDAERANREELQRYRETTQRQWDKNARRCPTCMRPLSLRPITIKKGKGNIKGYTCHWFCKEDNCDFEEYSYENFKEIYQRIMGGR